MRPEAQDQRYGLDEPRVATKPQGQPQGCMGGRQTHRQEAQAGLKQPPRNLPLPVLRMRSLAQHDRRLVSRLAPHKCTRTTDEFERPADARRKRASKRASPRPRRAAQHAAARAARRARLALARASIRDWPACDAATNKRIDQQLSATGAANDVAHWSGIKPVEHRGGLGRLPARGGGNSTEHTNNNELVQGALEGKEGARCREFGHREAPRAAPSSAASI